MNKLIALLLIAFSVNSFARIEIGDDLTTLKDITFYDTDYKGILAPINWVSKNPVLERGYTFTVTDVSENCESKTIHGKYFRFCTRYIDLEAPECGMNQQDRVERRSADDSFKIFMRVADGTCKIQIDEKDNDAGMMFKKMSEDLLDKRSPVHDYFILHN